MTSKNSFHYVDRYRSYQELLCEFSRTSFDTFFNLPSRNIGGVISEFIYLCQALTSQNCSVGLFWIMSLFKLYTSIQLQYQVAFTTWARVFTCAFPHIVHFYWKLKVDSHETINRLIIVCNKSHHKFCFKLIQIPACKSTW